MKQGYQHIGPRESSNLLLGRTLVGVVLVSIATSPIWFASMPSLWAPSPVPLTVAIWVYRDVAHAFPAIAFALTFQSIGRNRAFGTWVVGLTLAALAASVGWAFASWDYGIQYQGLRHTVVVLTVNLAALVAVLAVALRGKAAGNWQTQYWALVCLFALLSWCGLPYLGETP